MKTILTLLLLWSGLAVTAQFPYEASPEHPFGLPNPEAPKEIIDFAPLIGECNCLSQTRGADGTWAKEVEMIWRFKYIMNGMAIQDETLKHDTSYAGSIRQFIPDSTRWYVHYYSSGKPTTVLPSWEGKKNQEGDIVLYRDQKAPNGMEGFYRITFSDISDKGFKWSGEWVSKDQSVEWLTWKIKCNKIRQDSWEEDNKLLIAANKSFSTAYMAGNYDALAKIYTEDGKILPPRTSIISGQTSIKDRFKLPEGSRIVSHEIRPEEINILGNYAFDYGYYHGKTEHKNAKITSWKGKYVVVWKKIGGEWKMYLDIWNPVEE